MYIYSTLGIGAIVRAMIAYLAETATLTTLSVAVTVFIVAAAIIYYCNKPAEVLENSNAQKFTEELKI